MKYARRVVNGKKVSITTSMREWVKIMEDDSISWEELANLTHATQVERFGWCICEDPEQGQLAEDCPKREGEE